MWPGPPTCWTWPRTRAICDAGCGTGGDVPALLDAAPEGTVTAVDSQEPFIAGLAQDWAADDRVWAEVGDMASLTGDRTI